MVQGTSEPDAGRRQIDKTDQMDRTNKKKTMRSKQAVQASEHVLLTDTAVSSSVLALCSVALADSAEMMHITSLNEIDINRRPSKYSQFAPESTEVLLAVLS